MASPSAGSGKRALPVDTDNDGNANTKNGEDVQPQSKKGKSLTSKVWNYLSKVDFSNVVNNGEEEEEDQRFVGAKRNLIVDPAYLLILTPGMVTAIAKQASSSGDNKFRILSRLKGTKEEILSMRKKLKGIDLITIADEEEVAEGDSFERNNQEKVVTERQLSFGRKDINWKGILYGVVAVGVAGVVVSLAVFGQRITLKVEGVLDSAKGIELNKLLSG